MNKPVQHINIYEAKTHLSSLVDRASKGETIVIAKSGTPLAKLVPLEEGKKKKKFKFGTMKGEFVVPDDFDAPLPDEILDAFLGKSD